MFIIGLTVMACSILLIQTGGNTITTYVGAVDFVLGYIFALIGYGLSKHELCELEERISKLEKKLEDDNDEKTSM